MQSEVNKDDDSFSRPLVYGVFSRTLKIVEVPYYISQRAAGFRISKLTFLLDNLGIDPLGEVTPVVGLKIVLYTPTGHRCVTNLGYRVASLLHYMPRFQAAVFASRAPVQCDARRIEHEVDHDIDHLCNSEPADFGHEHRLLCDAHIRVCGGPTNR